MHAMAQREDSAAARLPSEEAPALGSVSATWAPIKRIAINAFRLGVRFGSALLANTLKLVYTAQRSSSTGPYSLTCRWTQIE